MGDPFRKVATGQALDIPAQAYNAFIDAAVAHKQGGIVTPKAQSLRGQLEIVLKNTTDGDLRRFDVLGLGDPIIEPTDNETAFLNRIAFEGQTPDETDHYSKVAVLAEPIKAGKFGRALIAGITPVRIYVHDNKHSPQARYAMIANGVATHLISASSGPIQVLWHEPSAQPGWAMVSLGNNTQCAHRGIACAPAVRDDGCAWLTASGGYGSSGDSYCYVWPWDRQSTAPSLSDSTADQFIKVYLPSAGGMAPSIRQDNTLFYTLDHNGEGWAVSPPTDLFLGAIVPTALTEAPPGWVIMDDDATDIYPPNTTLDSLPEAMDIDDLRDRILFGAGERYPDSVFNNDHGPLDDNPPNVAPGVFDSYPYPANISFQNNYWVYGYSAHYLLRVN